MKFQILISLIFMLLSHKRVTLKQVMQRFGVSKSTALRYFDTLSLANVPIYSEKGRNGGFFIPDEYKISKGYLTKEEGEFLLALIKNAEDINIKTCNNNLQVIDSLREKLTYFNGN